MEIGLCHAQTFPVLIQALFKQLLDFGVPAKTQVIVENLQGIFIFSQCKLLQIIVLNYDFFYYNFCNYCSFCLLYVKTFGKFLFRTPFLPIFFPGGGGRFVRVIKMVRVVRVVRILGGRDGWVG